MAELRSAAIREVGDRAQALAKLTEHPSWQVLVVEFEEARQRALERLARELLAGGEDAAPIDQQKIAYRRGFLKGAADLLASPENALRELENELRKEP